MVRRLLQAGANPNAALLLGETPLMVASRSGNPDVVEQLLAKAANVNARAARGQTALMWAVSQKHPDVVKVLLSHRADVHARSESWRQMEAVSPHGAPNTTANSVRQQHAADVCGAGRRPRLSELLVAAGAKSTIRMPGASASDSGRTLGFSRSRQVPARQGRRPE